MTCLLGLTEGTLPLFSSTELLSCQLRTDWRVIWPAMLNHCLTSCTFLEQICKLRHVYDSERKLEITADMWSVSHSNHWWGQYFSKWKQRWQLCCADTRTVHGWEGTICRELINKSSSEQNTQISCPTKKIVDNLTCCLTSKIFRKMS